MSKNNGDFSYKDGISLKEHFRTVINELEDKTNLRFELQKIALDKAENATNLRLEGMNEWRGTMTDLTNRFIMKSEYDSRHQNLVDKIEANQKFIWLAMGGLAVLELALRFIN